MASELNYFGKLTETGLTVIARVYSASGVQVGADVSCTEAGVLSIYIGDMPTAPIGQYGVRFFNGSNLLGQGFINWDGSKEIDFNLDVEVSSRNSITPATPTNVTDAQAAIIAEVDANETKIDDVKAKTDLIPALL